MICSLAYSANALEVGEVRRRVRERERVDVDIGEVHRERTHLAEDSVGREASLPPRHFQGRSWHRVTEALARKGNNLDPPFSGLFFSFWQSWVSSWISGFEFRKVRATYFLCGIPPKTASAWSGAQLLYSKVLVLELAVKVSQTVSFVAVPPRSPHHHLKGRLRCEKLSIQKTRVSNHIAHLGLKEPIGRQHSKGL